MAKLTFTIESEDEGEFAGFMARLFGETEEGAPVAEAPKRKGGRPPKNAAAGAAQTEAENTPVPAAAPNGPVGETQAESGPLPSIGSDTESDDPMTAALAAEAKTFTMDDVKAAMKGALDKKGAAEVMKQMKLKQADATSTATIKPENYGVMIKLFEELAA